MRNQYEKQEKVLWYAQIMIFLGALATWFNHMDMHTFYTINIILSVMLNYNLRFWFAKLNSWKPILDKYKCYQLRF